MATCRIRAVRLDLLRRLDEEERAACSASLFVVFRAPTGATIAAAALTAMKAF